MSYRLRRVNDRHPPNKISSEFGPRSTNPHLSVANGVLIFPPAYRQQDALYSPVSASAKLIPFQCPYRAVPIVPDRHPLAAPPPPPLAGSPLRPTSAPQIHPQPATLAPGSSSSDPPAAARTPLPEVPPPPPRARRDSDLRPTHTLPRHCWRIPILFWLI